MIETALDPTTCCLAELTQHIRETHHAYLCADVWGLDVVDPIAQTGTFDVIVEATGIARREVDLLDALAMKACMRSPESQGAIGR